MSTVAINLEAGRNPKPGRRCRHGGGRAIEQLERARLVEVRGFSLGRRRRLRHTADSIAGAELVLRLGAGTDAHRESARHAANLSVDDEEIAEVAVIALVERPTEIDARLDACDRAGPGELHGPTQ